YYLALLSVPTRRSSDLFVAYLFSRHGDEFPPSAELVASRDRQCDFSSGGLQVRGVAVACFAGCTRRHCACGDYCQATRRGGVNRSEEHTSELQSRENIV